MTNVDPCVSQYPRPDGVRAYLDFPGHVLQEHYGAAGYGGIQLLFRPEFRARYLPPAGTGDGFDLTVLDMTDGKTYTHKMYVAYEHHGLMAQDEDYNVHADYAGLQGYFYGSHHCPCHRKDYARAAGAAVPAKTAEEEKDSGGRDGGYCSGSRFQIQSITCPTLPGLVLYSETLDLAALESLLGHDLYGVCGT